MIVIELSKIEKKIIERTQEYLNKKVKETLGHLTREDSSVSSCGIWNAMNSIYPKHTAVKYYYGILVTGSDKIQNVCL